MFNKKNTADVEGNLMEQIVETNGIPGFMESFVCTLHKYSVHKKWNSLKNYVGFYEK